MITGELGGEGVRREVQKKEKKKSLVIFSWMIQLFLPVLEVLLFG